MRKSITLHRTGAAIVALVAMSTGAADAKPQYRHKAPATRSFGQPVTTEPSRLVLLSIGQGQLITLPVKITDIWTSNPGIADVYVSDARHFHLYGKAFGESTVYAKDATGRVVYSSNVRVSQNISSIDAMFKAAMPDVDVKITLVGQLAVLSGTVKSPEEAAQAQSIVTTMLNPGVDVTQANAQLKIGVINRLKTATPQQVMLQVRIAEVSHTFAKNIGNNLSTIDGTSGFKFGITQGHSPATTFTTNPQLPLGVGAGNVQGYTIDPTSITYLANGQIDPTSIKTIAQSGTAVPIGNQFSTIAGMGKLLGLNVLSALDLGETLGQVSTLANPNLTALSGETATFLAGGEIPIPIAQALGTVSVEYKQYGVSLAFTPTVLSDGRISMRVRPEVSELTSAGSVQLNGTTIPALTTRRVETTLELGSGQSMMIGGLLQNSHNNSLDKIPGVGDVPVLGALFRSNAWKRSETELVIVITPYLVKPVNNPADIKLPTDGEKAPTDLQRVLLGKLGGGTTGEARPVPTMEHAPAPTSVPAAAPVAQAEPTKPIKAAAIAPGFSN